MATVIIVKCIVMPRFSWIYVCLIVYFAKQSMDEEKETVHPIILELSGSSITLPNLNTGLGEMFLNSMEQNKDKLHQVNTTTTKTETKGSVRFKAIQVATELRNQGFRQGEVIIICSKNQFDQTIALLACHLVGAIVAPVHVDFPYDDMKNIIEILQPKFAFCGSRTARILSIIFTDKNINCLIYVFNCADQQYLSFSKCLEQPVPKTFLSATVSEPKMTVAFVMCTHGTNGQPKLVALSHHAIFVRYTFLAEFCKKTEKLLAFSPLCWIIQVLINCLAFHTQSTIVFTEKFSERGACKYIHDLQIENVFLESYFTQKVASNAPIEDFDLSCLKMLHTGGCNISPAKMLTLITAFPHVKIVISYLTLETGVLCSIESDDYLTFVKKVNSVGKVLPGVTMKIVDLTTDAILGPNKWGELVVQSPGMTSGYYKDSQKTSANFISDFFRTGDYAQFDEEGYVYIRGRVSDVVTKNNYTFSCTEIEDIIEEHIAVQEVAVIMIDKEIFACIVKKPFCEYTADNIIEYVQNTLPAYQLPLRFKFCEYFPKTLQGLIKKYTLKEILLSPTVEQSLYNTELLEN